MLCVYANIKRFKIINRCGRTHQVFFRPDYPAIFNKRQTHRAGRPPICISGFKVNSNKAIGETGHFQHFRHGAGIATIGSPIWP